VIRTRIKPRSTRNVGWDRWRKANYERLAEAMRYGTAPCAGCGALGSLEIHHVAGRVPEPWASDLACLVALCASKCHPAVTGALYDGMDGELRDRLRESARVAILEKYPTPYKPEIATLAAAIAWVSQWYEYDRPSNSIVEKP
jgi:hypothetical protein